jgi:hypothetical protein
MAQCNRRKSGIYSLYMGLHIVNDTEIIRLGWVAHIIRMEERILKMILDGKFPTQDQ